MSGLTTDQSVGDIDNMKADLVYRHRMDFEDGAILEIVVWRLPRPVDGCTHPFKYRLYYGQAGRRIIGFDNERPKGTEQSGTEQSGCPFVCVLVCDMKHML